MGSRQRRTDAELQEMSGHILWHVQQLCFLAIHLEERQGGDGVTRFDYPLDAAALEAFLIHARALGDFLWADAPRTTDGVAADFFDPGHVRLRPSLSAPAWFNDVRNVIGYGVAHVSYKRLALDPEWAWQHRVIATDLAAELERFAQDAPPDRVADRWASRLRKETAPVLTHLPREVRPVGTPMVAFYSNPRPPVGPDRDAPAR
jgi:hypothetical protein